LKSVHLTLSSACAALAIGLSASPAIAQNATDPQNAASTADESAGIGDIVVTARRREESLQKTPIAITALNSAALETRNVVNLADVSKLAPNMFVYRQTGVLGSTVASIRGISTTDNTLGQDSPIGIYLDGIAVGRLNASTMDLVEPDSVQVLRGPQGTLFGRNTTAGAIIVQSHTPTDDFSGRVKASYGTYNDRRFSARVDSGLLGESGIKLTAAYTRRQKDGYIDAANLPDYQDPGSEESEAFFGKIMGQWGDFKATLTGDWSKLSGNPASLQTTVATSALAQYNQNSPSYGGTSIPITTTPLLAYDSWPYALQQVSSKGATLTLEYRAAAELTLKAIGGLRSYWRNDPASYGSLIKGPYTTGNPPVPAGIGTFNSFFDLPNRRQNQRQKSLELQALGSLSDFDYVLGLYYFNEHGYDFGETRLPNVSSGTLASLVNTFREYTVASTSKAAFGQVSWKPAFLDKRLELTGGIRHTKDNRNFNQTRSVVRSVDLQTTNTSYLASASYQVTDGLLTYVKYSTGYRSGGYNVRAPGNVNPIFKPEFIKSWEAGVKLDALDRRLRLNVAAFSNKYDDLQVSTFEAPTINDAGGAGNINAKARIKGFEVEATVAPVEGLTLTGSWGYLDAKYTRYPIALNAGGVVGNGCAGILSAGGTPVLQDCAAIADFRAAPKSTIDLSASYVLPQAYGEWLFSVNWSHRSFIYGSIVDNTGNGFKPLVSSAPYGLLGGRIALSKIPLNDDNVTAQISVFGANLTDRRYTYGGTEIGQFGTVVVGDPRTVGVEASISF